MTSPEPKVCALAATEDDVRHAYRLLLGREPDPAGFKHHCGLIEERRPTTRMLARSFMHSAEYAARNNLQPVEVALDGYSVFVRPEDHDIGQHVMRTHEYEPHVTRVLRSVLRAGDVFVDIGANIGFFTNLAAHLVGADGFVFAIEPMDKNLQLIYRSIARNGYRQVQVYACAASDTREIVCVATGPGTSNGQVLVLEGDGSSDAMLYSQTVRLDEVLGDLERLDLVKFDIEGFELRAWSGFRRTLERLRPVVLTEFHPYCMRTHAHVDPDEYLRTLFAYGDVCVLPYHGDPQPCAGAADVMRLWQQADQAARGDGTNHLDLKIQPRPRCSTR